MKNAFLDATNRVLKAHGYCAANAPGDITIAVPEDFALEPGAWRHDGVGWVAYARPPTQDEQDRASAKADAVVQYLREHTPAECALYVRNNVTDLASAKAVMEKFAMVLSVLSRGL